MQQLFRQRSLVISIARSQALVPPGVNDTACYNKHMASALESFLVGRSKVLWVLLPQCVLKVYDRTAAGDTQEDSTQGRSPANKFRQKPLGTGIRFMHRILLPFLFFFFFFLVKQSSFASAQAKSLCKLKQIVLAPLNTCTRLDQTHHIANHLLETKWKGNNNSSMLLISIL